ncbi:DUF3093 domain-containing protein [Nocardioides sp.]|uniref:DUF3093 domain-containing protein n=1 Tax=Nocardioides sp. TaxID=35761 RepID=UPI0027372494|nr:DUF3093 domain-containing protein [Nocardioides sp.]MDP3891225.1 DUF3093 domain-containing protein [Nocardioides sp.]
MGHTTATFSERLRVPFHWWILGGLFVASFWVAMVVAIPAAAAWGITAALMAMLASGLSSYGGARIIVEDGWLQAGRTRIDVKFVGPVLALDKRAARELSGRLADARAFLLVRPYLPCAVRIEIDDPEDPTPYWMVGSRHPALLVDALNKTGRHVTEGTSGTY